ncbi:MAG: hypothetical protein GF364_16070 [Candidatus Lokiarchaeota archaeon]|nr:hypothetical protein [Candidatus Lokiarchaeota archaeon]
MVDYKEVNFNNTECDWGDFEQEIRHRIAIEIAHGMRLISDQEYYDRYPDNAEILNRDYEIWLEIQKFDEESNKE